MTSTNELHRRLRNTEATIANTAGLDRGLVTFEAGERVVIKGITYNGAEGRIDAQVEKITGTEPQYRTVALSSLRTAR